FINLTTLRPAITRSIKTVAALTRPIENICASQGELKIHLKSGLLFKLAEAFPMESVVFFHSGRYS
ncbi:hypothetical protein, partial [Oceanobacillus locisalsi]